MYRCAIALAVVMVGACQAAAQVNVTTAAYNNGRTGLNSNETILTPSNVNFTLFGKLFSHAVDGQMYAQPLYLANLTIPGKGTHNVMFIATEGDSVYAFDADNNTGANATFLWKASLLDAAHGAASGAVPATSGDVSCTDLQPNIGITSTPVIDPTSNTMYVVAKSKENGSLLYRVHALDITTGNEKFAQSPQVITATVAGTGDGSVGGQITFNPVTQLNRTSLLLMNGTIYVAFGSHCDISPYHGWIFSYNASTLAQSGVFVTTLSGGLGGIWMAGAGLAADANGNIFTVTGNGTFDTSHIPATMYSDSILKMSGTNLAVTDYFTPYNQGTLSNGDTDLGSGGVLLLPDQPGAHPHLLVEVGKQGTIYLVNRDQMTLHNKFYCSPGCSSDPQIVQELQNAIGGMWSSPAYWNGNVYFWGLGDVLKSYSLTNGRLSNAPISSGINGSQYPSISPSISASGNTNGIVWTLFNDGSDSPVELHAYDALNLSNEFYNSTQAQNPANRDQAGVRVKFTVPIIANGKVYAGTSSEVDVYGLLSSGTSVAPTITTQPASQTVGVRQTATFTVVASGTAPLSYQWSKNGMNISGATSASYTTPPVLASDNGAIFSVVVTNAAGSATSNPATLSVSSPPVITTQPANQAVTVGQTATFTVVASGTAPVSYQWSKNGMNISGATSASYTTPPTVASDNGAKFKVVVTNAAGSARSNVATLTVNSAAISQP